MPIPIIMPKFGFTLETCEIVQWLKQEGDTVRNGDPICEVTTDKVNMEVEAPESGTLWNLLFKQGDVVPVTEVICYLLRPGEEPPPKADLAAAAAPSAPPPDGHPAPSPRVTPVAQRVADAANVDVSTLQGTGPNQRITRRDVESAVSATTAASVPTVAGRPRATPAARRIASESGIELGSLAGSGPRGRIQGADVEAALAQMTPSAPPPTLSTASTPAAIQAGSPPRVVRLEGMRKTIATRLQKSFQTAPHIFFDADIDTTALDGLRTELKARNEKLSVTALLVKACAWTLLRHPWLNATLEGDEVTLWPVANIGMAVALDNGLVVPVIQQSDQLNLRSIQARVDDLAGRARANKLSINDMVDGTFTISNLGMFGVDRFTAIINPPQVAILAVGRTQQRFVPDAQGQPTLKSFMTVTLSADHRVVDGAQVAQFLQDLRSVLESPALLVW